MISRSFFGCTRKTHQSIFHSLLAHPTQLPKPSPIIPPSSSFSTVPFSSISQPHPENLIRLNHKDWLSPQQVLKIFNALNDSNSVMIIWDQYSKRKDYKPNEAIYTLVIDKLAQGNQFDAIEDIMKRIKLEKSCRLSEEFFYNVIKIYGNLAGRISKAIETLFDMPKYNCWPTVKTFNFVLNLLVSAKLYDVVHEIYMDAPKLGIEIDACCLNILIKGLCECGNLKAAFYVLDEFPKQKCRPNVRTFSTLMCGLCENGRVEEAFELLERMEKEGIDPDTITFNILISGLRKEGRVEEGMELLERMKLKGCYPNSGSYQEVLYGLLDANKFMEAKVFMGWMISKDVSPSLVSYKKLIRGLCEKKLLGDVDWVLKQMVQRGFVPKMGIWRQILRSLFSEINSNNCISLAEIVDS